MWCPRDGVRLILAFTSIHPFGVELMSSKHGLSRTPEYTAWIAMLQRCGHRGDPKTVVGRSYYGGRGISVCEQWRSDFLEFLSCVGPRSSRNHILGRLDTYGNYDPEDAVWILRKAHAELTRERLGVVYQGRKWTYKSLAQLHGMQSAAFRRRLALGWETTTALHKPVRGSR